MALLSPSQDVPVSAAALPALSAMFRDTVGSQLAPRFFLLLHLYAHIFPKIF